MPEVQNERGLESGSSVCGGRVKREKRSEEERTGTGRVGKGCARAGRLSVVVIGAVLALLLGFLFSLKSYLRGQI